MNKSDLNILYFGIYVFLLGVLFIAESDMVLKFFLFEEFKSEWVQVIGAIFIAISALNIIALKFKLYWFYLLASVAKSTAFVWITALYLFGYVAFPIVLIGIIDLASGLWTIICMRQERLFVRFANA